MGSTHGYTSVVEKIKNITLSPGVPSPYIPVYISQVDFPFVTFAPPPPSHTDPSAMASERAKKLGKRIIDYPEEQPSVISSKDWVQNLVKDPKDFVRQLPLTLAILYSL
jgi:hypothetical protein